MRNWLGGHIQRVVVASSVSGWISETSGAISVLYKCYLISLLVTQRGCAHLLQVCRRRQAVGWCWHPWRTGSRRTWTSSWRRPTWISGDLVRSGARLYTWVKATLVSTQVGWWTDQEQSCQKSLGVLVDEKLDLTISVHSQGANRKDGDTGTNFLVGSVVIWQWVTELN